MDDVELKSILSSEIESALGMPGSILSDERMRLLKYYEGSLPAGNGIADRSQLTDRAVLEVIHWLLPDLVRVFLSTDKIISFEPRQPDDTRLAQAITEYVSFILREDNQGFLVIYEWIKTSLTQKNAFLKVSYEPQTQIRMNSYTGLTDHELDLLKQEWEEAERYEIKDQHDYPDPSFVPLPVMQPMSPMPPPGPPGQANGVMNGMLSPKANISASPMQAHQPIQPPQQPPQPMQAPMPPQAAPMLHDIRCVVYTSEGRVVIRHVLPEEVLISPRCPSTRFDGSHFVAHRAKKTITDLRLAGYSEELIKEARGADEPEMNMERITRFSRDDEQYTSRNDEAMVPIWICECYHKVDVNDDGIAELRKIVTAGDGAVILENEECDEVPIINLTPIIEPGRAIGTSISELVVDLQETRTQMIRGVMDSLYLSLIPRNVVNVNKLTEDTFEDLNEGSPGVSIRVNDDNAVTPLTVPFVGQSALPVLEWINQQIQIRTGVGPQNNIISPDVLNNQTAAGISMQQNAASAQIELICRVMAETGFRELARHILGLVVRHQDKPRMIRLNGEFVEMDPRYWHENFDISVTVGLGTGNKEKTTRDLMGVLQIMQPILMEQKGMQGPFITSQDVHAVTSKLTEAMGYKDDFFPHLEQPAPTPPGAQQQDPAIMKAQQQAQLDAQKGQIEMQIMKQKAELEYRLESEKHQAEMVRERERAQNQMAIETMRAEAKNRLQEQQLTAQIVMDATP